MQSDSRLYDKERYYDSDGSASRLAPSLNGLLLLLDAIKAWLFARRLRALSPPLRQRRGAILDVGAGDGKFLYFMRRQGYRVDGTTASQISQQAAARRFNVGLHLATEIPANLAAPKFDAITYWHVFEHLENPAAHVQRWSEVLDDHGLVMLEVPHIDSIGAKLSFSAWLGSDLKHHVNHMSLQKISALLKQHKFAIIRQEGFSLKFSYVFLWSALLGACFGATYNFDRIFALIKDPKQSLRQAPIRTINGLAAIIYGLPIILPLMVVGLLCGRGEVLRLYIKKSA